MGLDYEHFIDCRSIIQLLLLLPPTTAATTDVNWANPTVEDILWARGNMLEKSISEITFPQQHS